MKYKICIYLLGILMIVSCKNEEKGIPSDLRKLTEKEQIEIAEKRLTYNYDNVIFKNEKGETISADSVKSISSDFKFSYDTYLNKKNEPELVIVRETTQKDIELRKKLKEIYKKEVINPVVPVDINCSDIKNILTKVLSLDQDMRNDGDIIDPNIDRENLVTVVSLIEKCGMPNLDIVEPEQMSAIWLVFQHSDNYHRKKYLPILKKSVDNGDIRKSAIALLEDRILMYDGKPQIYGTQITKNPETEEWIIYDLKEPETVDKRRAKVGLNPLNEYLRNWNIEFTVKQTE